MEDVWKFLCQIDWTGVIIPVFAILIPTIIAIRLARRERSAAREDRIEARADAAKERRLQASEGVIVGLAHLISVDPTNAPMQERLGELRGRIAVYRAWIEPDDLSGDWLALQHTQGMRLWSIAMESANNISGGQLVNLGPPRQWAQSTIETFSGWLSGQIDVEVLRAEGAEMLADRSNRQVHDPKG